MIIITLLYCYSNCCTVCVCVGGGAERWLDRVKEEEGVGTVLMYIRWISNSSEDLPGMRVM